MSQRTPVPVLITGLDQKAVKETAVMGTLDVLQNMIATKAAGGGYEFVPRPGTSHLSKTSDAGTIPSGKRLGTLGNQLLLQSGGALYRKATDEWHQVDANAPIFGVTTTPVVSSATVTDATDTAYVNGYYVSASVTGGIFGQALVVTVIDASGATVLSTVRTTATVVDAPRVVASGTAAIILWQTNGLSVFASKLDTATMTFGAPVTVSATAATAGSLDAQAVGASGTVVVSYLSSATSTWHLRLITVSSMALGTDVNTTIGGFPCFSLMANDWSTNVIYAVWGGSGNLMTVTTFNGSTLATTGTTPYGSATLWKNMSGTRVGANLVLVGTTSPDGINPPANVYDYLLAMVFVTGGTGSAGMRGLYLASKAFTAANGHTYAMARYRGTGQSSLFLVDVGTQQSVGRALPNVAYAGNDQSNNQLPGLAPGPDANTWITGAIKNTADISEGGLVTTYTGAVSIAWRYNDSSIDRGVEVLGWHFPGSLPMLYDGGSLTEDGFPIGPEPNDTPVQAVGGNLTLLATYTIRCCYAWTDFAGNVHRSLPTIVAQQFTLTGTNQQATLSIPTLRNTHKAGVVVEVYATPANGDGSSYFLASDPTLPVFNDPTVDRVTFLFNLTDTQIEQGVPLYTDGGVLDNISPPPCRTMGVHRGRILIGGIDGDPQAVWFSKDVNPGFGVSFSDGLVSRLNNTTEAVTAVGSLNTYAVAMTPTTTWECGQDYPDDTGNGGVLQFLQYSNQTGVATPGMAARNDQGILLYSGVAKGAWRLTGGSSFEYVGAQVETDLSALTPVAVISVPGESQMRIIAGTTALVYESIYGTWAKWTYAQAPAAFVDAIVWMGQVAYLCSDGTVVLETSSASVIDDNGAPVSHVITLSGMNPAGIAGFWRLAVCQPTGRIIGTGGFTLNAAQVCDNTVVPTKTMAFTTETEINTEVDPGTSGKCSQYQISFSDSANGANSSFTLSAVTLLIAQRDGLNKLPPSRRMT